MALPTDFNSTPTGYQTPEQISQNYELSKALMKGGQRDSTITSPWQGVRMLADTAAGRMWQNRAAAQQMNNLKLDAAKAGNVVPFGASPAWPSQTPSTPPTASTGSPAAPFASARPIPATSASTLAANPQPPAWPQALMSPPPNVV